MSAIQKGDDFEKDFFRYLIKQKDSGWLVYDTYPPELCQIFHKKDYYCKERDGTVNFDVVIELYRRGGESPHSRVIFECKNHARPIQERDVTDFSDKISRIFGHSVKGVVVSSTSLQKGAENVARSRNMGIVKFDREGIEVVAERKENSWTDSRHVEKQLYGEAKSLKISGFYDGVFVSSVLQLLVAMDSSLPVETKKVLIGAKGSVSFIANADIERMAENVLKDIGYRAGEVNLEDVCSNRRLALEYSGQVNVDRNNSSVLGEANFNQRLIKVNLHGDEGRQRFTLAHEIGHFELCHDKYICSETVVEGDLLATDADCKNMINYERLEYQANIFASMLLLPKVPLLARVDKLRSFYDIKDRGHGYIFVDDQPCNFGPYDGLVSDVADYFRVSKQATEIRLAKMGLVIDQRRRTFRHLFR